MDSSVVGLLTARILANESIDPILEPGNDYLLGYWAKWAGLRKPMPKKRTNEFDEGWSDASCDMKNI